MTTPARMTKERLDQIKQIAGNYNSVTARAVRELLSELAAVTRERNEAIAHQTLRESGLQLAQTAIEGVRLSRDRWQREAMAARSINKADGMPHKFASSVEWNCVKKEYIAARAANSDTHTPATAEGKETR